MKATKILKEMFRPEPRRSRWRIVYIGTASLNYCRASLCARSFVAEFRKPSLDVLGIRLRERLNTELNE